MALTVADYTVQRLSVNSILQGDPFSKRRLGRAGDVNPRAAIVRSREFS
jgi:hypothetical protein